MNRFNAINGGAIIPCNDVSMYVPVHAQRGSAAYCCSSKKAIQALGSHLLLCIAERLRKHAVIHVLL